jgi:hypothetical protein
MPKVIIEYKIPEEEQEFILKWFGDHATLVLWDFLANTLRGWIKYGNHECKTPAEAFEKCRDYLYAELESKGIHLDSIVY